MQLLITYDKNRAYAHRARTAAPWQPQNYVNQLFQVLRSVIDDTKKQFPKVLILDEFWSFTQNDGHAEMLKRASGKRYVNR